MSSHIAQRGPVPALRPKSLAAKAASQRIRRGERDEGKSWRAWEGAGVTRWHGEPRADQGTG